MVEQEVFDEAVGIRKLLRQQPEQRPSAVRVRRAYHDMLSRDATASLRPRADAMHQSRLHHTCIQTNKSYRVAALLEDRSAHFEGVVDPGDICLAVAARLLHADGGGDVSNMKASLHWMLP